MSDVSAKTEWLKNTKEAIKRAIIEKGVEVLDTDTFRSYANKITLIVGDNPSPNNQDKTFTENGVYTFDEGYTGLGTVTINVEQPIVNKSIKDIKLTQTFSDKNVYLINTSLSGIPHSMIEDKELMNILMIESKNPILNGLVYNVTYNSEIIMNGFGGTDWFIEYDDKPMDVVVPSGSFVDFVNQTSINYTSDTYWMYNDKNDYGFNGCLINYDDNGSEKAMNAYLVEDDYQTETENYDIVGSTTVDNKIIKTFSGASYLSFGNMGVFDASVPWSVKTKVYLTTTTPTEQEIVRLGNSIMLRTNSNKWKIIFQNSSNTLFINTTSSTTWSTNTWYWLEMLWDGSYYKLKVSTDGLTYTNVISSSSTTIAYNSKSQNMLGSDSGSCYIGGSGQIDLTETKVYRNGDIWWEPYIEKTVTKNKVLLIDGEMTDDLLETTDYDRYHFIKQVIVPEHDTYTPTIVDVPTMAYVYAKVGTLTEVNDENGKGFSGFSLNNYIRTYPQNIVTQSSYVKNWEMVFKFKYVPNTSYIQCLYSSGTDYENMLYVGTDGIIRMALGNSTSSHTIGTVSGTTLLSSSKIYYAKACFTGTQYEIWLSENGTDWHLEGTKVSSTAIYLRGDDWRIGVNKHSNSSYQYPFKGIIYLNGSYVMCNGYKVWEGYVDSKDYPRFFITGSPVIINKLAQGFSSNDYLTIPSRDAQSTFEIYGVLTPNNAYSWQSAFSISVCQFIKINSGKLGTYNKITGDVCNFTFTNNRPYWFKCIMTDVSYKVYFVEYIENELPTDDLNDWYLACEITDTSALDIYRNAFIDGITIGINKDASYSSQYWYGNVYLNEFKIIGNDGNILWQPYYQEYTQEVQLIKDIK